MSNKLVKVNKKELHKAIRNSNSTKSSLSLFSYFEVKNNKIKIYTFDEGYIIYTIPANATSEFSFVVNTNEMLNVLKLIKTKSNILLRLNDGNIEIMSEKTTYTIPISDYLDFPQVKEMSKNIITSIPEKLLKDAIEKTSYLIPSVDVNYKFSKTKRLCFTFTTDMVEIVGTDGRRMSLYKIPTKTTKQDISYTIFIGSVKKLKKLLYNSKFNVDIAVEDGYIFFKGKDWLFYTEVQEGFLDYKQLLNLNFMLEIALPTTEFKSFLRSVMSSNILKESPVRLEILNNEMKIYSNEGSLEGYINLKYSNIEKPFIISVSGKFLYDAIRQMDSDYIVIKFMDKYLPLLIYPENNKDYLTVIASMRN